jgi:hypothetical protein
MTSFGAYDSLVFICATTQLGCTALIRAAENGRTDCVRLLIEVGADKDAKMKARFLRP